MTCTNIPLNPLLPRSGAPPPLVSLFSLKRYICLLFVRALIALKIVDISKKTYYILERDFLICKGAE